MTVKQLGIFIANIDFLERNLEYQMIHRSARKEFIIDQFINIKKKNRQKFCIFALNFTFVI